MGTFTTADDIYECIGSLFTWAGEHKELAPKFKELGIVIRMSYTEPEAKITIDTKTLEWTRGEDGRTPDVEFFMKGDVGHRFWLGKVNLLVALAKRDVVAKGPITKIMKILPILKPMYEHYPKILKQKGKTDLVSA